MHLASHSGQVRLHTPCSVWDCKQRHISCSVTGFMLLPPRILNSFESWVWLSSPNSIFYYNKYANAKRMDSFKREWLTRHRGPEAEVWEEVWFDNREIPEDFSERHFRKVMKHGAERKKGENVWRERVRSQFKLKAYFSWTKITLMQIIVRYSHTEVTDNIFKNIFKNQIFTQKKSITSYSVYLEHIQYI